jgi:hypothetical protein
MIVKKIMIIITTLSFAFMGLASPLYSNNMEGSEKMVKPGQDNLLGRVEKSDKEFKRLQIGNVASFFHTRMIGPAIVEKDYIRYQFNTDTGELIETKKQWREALPETVTPVITKGQAESMVEGAVQFSELYIISPDTDVFPVKPTPKNPCWVVRSIDNSKPIMTIIDSITGEKLGYGVPPPSEGLSIHGPDTGACPQNPIWDDWAENARSRLSTMGYSTVRVGNASQAIIQGHIQSDDGAVFYEIDHGGSVSFHNQCNDDTTATEVETWIDSYSTIPFTFLASCDGMCSVSNNTFSYEFRKGSNIDTAVVGYCGMSLAQCNACWGSSIDWQTSLFNRMSQGWTVGNAFNQANLDWPVCAGTNNCVRISGDTSLRFAGATYGNVQRSKCGAIYDSISPLNPVSNRLYTRAHHIRCNSNVPAGQTLSVNTTSSKPYNEVAFVNNSKITVNGTLNANGQYGEVALVSATDRNKGIKINGQLKILNGGQIKIYE